MALGGITAVFIWLVVTFSVVAHGGGKLVANEPVGELTVSVWFNPETPANDETLHVTVGLAEGVDQTPALNEQINIIIRRADDQRLVWQGEATTEASVNRLFYEADITAVSRGEYELTVTVADHGQLLVPLTITLPGTDYRLLGIGSALAAVMTFFFYRRRQQMPPEQSSLPKRKPR